MLERLAAGGVSFGTLSAALFFVIGQMYSDTPDELTIFRRNLKN